MACEVLSHHVRSELQSFAGGYHLLTKARSQLGMARIILCYFKVYSDQSLTLLDMTRLHL